MSEKSHPFHLIHTLINHWEWVWLAGKWEELHNLHSLISLLLPSDCDGQLDIVLMIDTSGSIRESRFNILQDFAQDFVLSLEISSDTGRIGTLSYSDDVKVEFNLGTYHTAEDVAHAIEMIQYRAGKTNTAEALRVVREDMFTEANGDRSDVPNILIIITDGISTVNTEETIPEAVKTKVSGIHILLVGAEISSTDLELKALATDPDDKNIFTTPSFTDMSTLLPNVLDAICDGESLW